jgi:plasmid stabilization system protein ParE
MKYKFHPEAFEEYLQATTWYTERDPAIALGFVESVEGAIKRILTHPVVGESSMKISGAASRVSFPTQFSTRSKTITY